MAFMRKPFSSPRKNKAFTVNIQTNNQSKTEDLHTNNTENADEPIKNETEFLHSWEMENEPEECIRQKKISISKGVFLFMIIACVYLVFLIFGVYETNYEYDAYGNMSPTIMTVEDYKILAQYNELSSHYIRVKDLYQNILDLDAKMSKETNYTTLARKYTELLETVSKLTTDISALDLDYGLTPIQEQMYALVYTDIGAYLQNVAGAITENSSEKAQQAVTGRETILSNFTTLTNNMASVCKDTQGSRNADIYAWNPKEYTKSQLSDDTSDC